MTTRLTLAVLVCAAILAEGASADELSALKAQIEELEGRLPEIDIDPAVSLPSSSGQVSVRDGRAVGSTVAEPMRDRIKPDSGATIYGFPTSSAEISVFGETRILLTTD
jgi:hypothetical protein